MPGADHVEGRFTLDDPRDLGPAIERCRALLDLDSDPAAVAAALGTDPLIGPLVRATPGRRVPGHVDGHELAIAPCSASRCRWPEPPLPRAASSRGLGRPLERPVGSVTHLFPSAEALADVDPARAAHARCSRASV